MRRREEATKKQAAVTLSRKWEQLRELRISNRNRTKGHCPLNTVLENIPHTVH